MSSSTQPLTGNSIQHLLEIAGVPSSEKSAASWLGDAIEGARSSYQAAKQRPTPAEHNSLLADIEKNARELSKHIRNLRRLPVSWRAFWRSRPFGPVNHDRIEVPAVLTLLEAIAAAADAAKERRRGRPPEIGKQHVVNLGFAFFARFSPYEPSGTTSGAFSTFVHAFYAAVTGVDSEEHGGLDRQIRQAATRLPIERVRAQRKPREKSRDSS